MQINNTERERRAGRGRGSGCSEGKKASAGGEGRRPRQLQATSSRSRCRICRVQLNLVFLRGRAGGKQRRWCVLLRGVLDHAVVLPFVACCSVAQPRKKTLRDVNGEEDTAAMKMIACERRREQRRVMQQVSELGGWKESTKTKQKGETEVKRPGGGNERERGGQSLKRTRSDPKG